MILDISLARFRAPIRTLSTERIFSRSLGCWDFEDIVRARGHREEAVRDKGCEGEGTLTYYSWAAPRKHSREAVLLLSCFANQARIQSWPTYETRVPHEISCTLRYIRRNRNDNALSRV